MFSEPFRHEFDIGEIIIIAEKCFLATVTSLGNVMRVARSYYACDSGHVEGVALVVWLSKISILSPELRGLIRTKVVDIYIIRSKQRVLICTIM
jgi:hypothetical protein